MPPHIVSFELFSVHYAANCKALPFNFSTSPTILVHPSDFSTGFPERSQPRTLSA